MGAPVSARRWNVTHACETADQAVTLAQAQAEIGMRPALLTPAGWFNPGSDCPSAPPLSLIHAWRRVRHWRNVFQRADVGHPGEILHAHCFSAAMAGVRAGLPVVYDVAAPLGSVEKAGPWLLRSLRLAESFLLSRSAAVVVHSQQMWTWALEQGARVDDLFLVPQPAHVPTLLFDETQWLLETVGHRPAVTLLAPSGSGRRPAEHLETILRGFARLAAEVDDVHLLYESSKDVAAACARIAASQLSDRVHPIDAGDRWRALSCCDIVLAGETETGPNADAIEALAFGRALLAADVAANREVSPQGRGCLWFSAGNERDLAYRAAFLARNPDFRAALGANGRAHVTATRSFPVVARSYDEVYRHALARQSAGQRPDVFHRAPALAVC